MNPELPDLKNIGTEALRDLLNNLTQAKGFVLDQAPDFCQQMIARGMIMPLFLGLFFIALCVGFGIAVPRFYRLAKTAGAHDGDEFTGVMGTVFSTAAAFLFLGLASVNLYAALAVYIAPKVYLVEQIGRMLK